MKNTYGKALRHLKNRNIDEKLKLVEAIPTNNTTGVMMDVPGEFVTVPGEVPREADLGTDGDGVEGYTGADTSGLFLEDGTILIEEPIGDKSYVLGPMISMWYSWANYTQIGYVRQSDRKMVNLGRITGELEDWDGENGFTSYGQMTIEQAVWYKQQSRSDYRAFYPGPPSNPADEFGRYIGSMVNTTKSTTTVVKQQDTTKPFDASDNYSAQIAATYGGKEAENRKKIRDMLNNPNDPFYLTPGQGQPSRGRGMGDRWFPSASSGTNTQVAHYEPEGKVLSENRKRILRDLRKPVHVEEIGPPTKFRFKPSGRNNKSVGVDMMKIPDTPAQYKPPMNIWGKGDYNANVRSSQEKKNEVLELVGASEHHWTYLTDESSRKKQDKINEMQAAEYDKELELLYEKHQMEEKKTKKLKILLRKEA